MAKTNIKRCKQCKKTYRQPKGRRKTYCKKCEEAKVAASQCNQEDCTNPRGRYKYCEEHRYEHLRVTHILYNFFRRYKTTYVCPTEEDIVAVVSHKRFISKRTPVVHYPDKILPLPVNPLHIGHGISYSQGGNCARANLFVQLAKDNISHKYEYQLRQRPDWYPIEPNTGEYPQTIKPFTKPRLVIELETRFPGIMERLQSLVDGYYKEPTESLWDLHAQQLGYDLRSRAGTNYEDLLSHFMKEGIQIDTKEDPTMQDILTHNCSVLGLSYVNGLYVPKPWQIQTATKNYPNPIEILHRKWSVGNAK